MEGGHTFTDFLNPSLSNFLTCYIGIFKETALREKKEILFAPFLMPAETKILVLLTASVKGFFVSRMRNFYNVNSVLKYMSYKVYSRNRISQCVWIVAKGNNIHTFNIQHMDIKTNRLNWP